MSLRPAAVALLVLGLAAPARASRLDTPSLWLVTADRTSITLEVRAGGSGAPAGFTVEWMSLADYQKAGGWPADGAGVQGGDFHGVPTLNVTPETVTYRLDPGQAVSVVLGRLFDETGVASTDREELPEGTAYVVRVCASAGDGLESSPPSPTLTASTRSPGVYDCTLTQGYWKNHPGSWVRVTSVMLGGVTYSQSQLLAIFGRPATGNGLVSLAHQLIAARLNLLLGVIAPPEVAAAISRADALIGAKVVPPIGSGALSPSLTAGLTSVLDSFNSGSLGPGHCPDGFHPVPARLATWGTLKSIYR